MRLPALFVPGLCGLLLAPCTALAQASGEPASPGLRPAGEQVIVPEVARRPIKVPRYPSNDFSIGLFSGVYSAQNFGSNEVDGLRLGYHITEDVFVEGVFARTKVSDATFRQILPGGVFPNGVEKLFYNNLSFGFNVLPGEVFVSRNTAMASSLYLVAGLGTTRFNNQRLQTVNLGVGSRVFLGEGAALQADMRNHVYSIDLLGERRITNNLELTVGVSFFF